MQLDHASVSRIHLLLEEAEAGWLVTDQVSKNGTRLDGQPIDRAIISSRGWLEAGGIPVLVKPRQEPVADPRRPGGGEGPADSEPHPDTPSPDPLDRAVHDLARISGCERASLWMVRDDGRFQPVARLGPSEPAPSMTAIGRAASTGRSEFCSDTEGARALAASESILSGGIRALFALPVLRDEKVVAVAYADSLQPGKLFTQHDADLLNAATRQLTLILDTERVRKMIRSIRQGL